MLQKFRALLLTLLFTHCTMSMAQTDSSVLPKPFGQGTYVPSMFGQIYYEADGEGIPVVMINGGPGAARTVFWGALDFLKPHGYQIIYFDETGVGRATREIPQKFSPAITVEDIETLRKHLNVPKLILAGHSYGGIPAVQYALTYPENIEKLIMLSASADGHSQQMNVDAAKYLRKTFFPQEWEQMEEIRAKGVLTSSAEYMKAFYNRAIGNMSDWYDPSKRAGLRKYRSNDIRDRSNIEVYKDMAGADPEVKISGTLKNVVINETMFKDYAIPTLILNGRKDWKTTPEMAYRFFKMLPEGTATIQFLEETGHWTWAEQPDEFANTVIQFMKNN
ncbi:proline iminopeptidase [Alteromonas sp. KUL42]|uniref:alpha/beta fold hydrolase n=1 Tax=Alteromonas sp. KUL42 TaxID=2480797 RepID=UPI001035796C|nr:alpha/beta fold hydrolase [Alteromonas sp. KUL42]TAP31415.1 alpha/beta fold hydrolase [Alteromonas sp. KUL42]GEA09416.1 proline iminopeptidase [Alteromonas sp. KUL42]